MREFSRARKLGRMTFNCKNTSVVLVVIVFAIAACAAGGSKAGLTAAERAKNCPLLLQDSVYSASAPVYRACAVTTQSRVIPSNLRPDYMPQTPYKECYSAELEFVVDVTGAAELRTAKLAHTNDSAYGESVMALLPRLRFEPGTLDGVPVRQIMTYKQSMAVRRVVVSSTSGSVSAPPSRASAPRC